MQPRSGAYWDQNDRKEYFSTISPIFTDHNILRVSKAQSKQRNAALKTLFVSLTSFEDDAVVRYFVPGLQAGTVPAVPSELMLALVDGDLDSLDGRGRHVRVAHAHLQLTPGQAR